MRRDRNRIRHKQKCCIIASRCDRHDVLAFLYIDWRSDLTKGQRCDLPPECWWYHRVGKININAAERLGRVDVLINNAGFGGMQRFWEMSPEDWNRILDTVLTGTFLCSREVVRGMLERETRGKIINIASTNAQIPSTGISAYCAAKGGVAMFTKAAALELAPHGISMNAIGPGTTLTPGTEGFYQLPGLREAFLDRTPMGRFGELADISRVVLMLASEYADWITGQLIMADGGQSLLGLPTYL